MKKLSFLMALLFLCSCTFSYKSRFSGVVLDDFNKRSNLRDKPVWLDVQNDENGLTGYGISTDVFENYSDRILEAENEAKTKILNNIKTELYDILKNTFDANSDVKKQNFEDPMNLVEEILVIIPIDLFRRIDIYQNKENNDIYVYGILNYTDINKVADKIESVVRNKLETLLFDDETINSCVEIIKKFFNIFEEEKI